MEIFKTESELVDCFISRDITPYESKFTLSELEVFKEFEIISKLGLHRYDLLIINKHEKRYDILEFKNRRLELKDAYQVYKYMKSFYENFFFKKAFDRSFDICFHLIGRDTEDDRVTNLYMVDSNNFKIHVFYKSNDSIDVYQLDTTSAIMSWT